MPIAVNQDIAGRLDEVSRILAEQGANRFRVQAYPQAAAVLRGLARPVSEIFSEAHYRRRGQLSGRQLNLISSVLESNE